MLIVVLTIHAAHVIIVTASALSGKGDVSPLHESNGLFNWNHNYTGTFGLPINLGLILWGTHYTYSFSHTHAHTSNHVIISLFLFPSSIPLSVPLLSLFPNSSQSFYSSVCFFFHPFLLFSLTTFLQPPPFLLFNFHRCKGIREWYNSVNSLFRLVWGKEN